MRRRWSSTNSWTTIKISKWTQFTPTINCNDSRVKNWKTFWGRISKKNCHALWGHCRCWVEQVLSGFEVDSLCLREENTLFFVFLCLAETLGERSVAGTLHSYARSSDESSMTIIHFERSSSESRSRSDSSSTSITKERARGKQVSSFQFFFLLHWYFVWSSRIWTHLIFEIRVQTQYGNISRANWHSLFVFPQIIFTASLCCALADVSHIIVDDAALTSTTEYYPPRPYAFAYQAGRAPGHVDSELILREYECAPMCTHFRQTTSADLQFRWNKSAPESNRLENLQFFSNSMIFSSCRNSLWGRRWCWHSSRCLLVCGSAQ